MLKVKEWLYDVERKESLIDKSKYKFRLDQSERVDDFSNEFFDGFLKTIKQTDFITYPYVYKLKNKIALYNDVDVKNIFLTPGSDLAIKTMFEICVSSGSEVLSTTPSFPMYNVYCNIHNIDLSNFSHVVRCHLNIEELFKKKINPVIIIESLERNFEDIKCIISPLKNGFLDIFLNPEENGLLKRGQLRLSLFYWGIISYSSHN